MRKSVATVGLATMLTFGSGTVAFATPDTTPAASTESASDDDGDSKAGLWGLLGLLGLAGLGGLKRRDDVRTVNTTPRTDIR